MEELEEDLTVEERIEKTRAIEKLNKKQRKFVEEYVLSQSPYKAAVNAGYSPKRAYTTAARLFQKPEIKKAIDALQYEVRMRHNIDRDYFIVHLKKIVEDKFNKTSDKISALTLLARITGHIKERPPEAKQLVILKQEGLPEKAIEIKTLDDID
jgi:phage terminase small subunit